MIEPVLIHLHNLGVDIHFDLCINDTDFHDGRLTGLISVYGFRFSCDDAIIALPYLTLLDMAT
ncbi:hypothetical protein [Mycobacterium lepromatosis]|uniref:hypothetical protein n=1 Tax=Mycobacterium lepromatosis TaxID=480418 RepID=UPI0006795106|nr:hypothetical protein [Mycobacterium lepromatosis]